MRLDKQLAPSRAEGRYASLHGTSFGVPLCTPHTLTPRLRDSDQDTTPHYCPTWPPQYPLMAVIILSRITKRIQDSLAQAGLVTSLCTFDAEAAFDADGRLSVREGMPLMHQAVLIQEGSGRH